MAEVLGQEGDLVFADVGVDLEAGFGALGGQVGEGGDGDGDVVSDAGALEGGLVGDLWRSGRGGWRSCCG